MAKDKQGFIIYHKWMIYENVLTPHQMGEIIFAALKYSAYGILPDFSHDPTAQAFWFNIMFAIDRDSKRYQDKCDTNAYSAYCKVSKNRGEVPISKEAFLMQRQSVNAHERNERTRMFPTTTTTPTTTPTTTTTTARIDYREPKDIGAEFSTLLPFSPEEWERARNDKLRMLEHGR